MSSSSSVINPVTAASLAGGLMILGIFGMIVKTTTMRSTSSQEGRTSTTSDITEIDDEDDDDNKLVVRGSTGSSKNENDDDDDYATQHDDSDYIKPNEVCKVFDRLFMEMQNVMAMLMNQIQQFQQMGQTIPEKQIRNLIRGEMERALLSKQKAIFDEHNMDVECLEEATWEFLANEDEHPNVKKAVERFQRLWENATGEPVLGWRPGLQLDDQIDGMGGSNKKVEILDAQRTIEVADKYFSSLTDLMKSLVDHYKSEGKSLIDPKIQEELNMSFARQANDTGEESLQKNGVTMRQFEESVKHHSSNNDVTQALTMMQMKQQQTLAAMGAA